MDNVQLEQAVRELNCFDGLLQQQQQDHHFGAPKKNHRNFAIAYLEAILERWSRSVEEARATAEQKKSQATSTLSSSSAGPPPPPPLNNDINLSIEAAVAAKPNVWQRPPSIPGMESSTLKQPHREEITTSTSSPVTALIPFGSYRLGVHSTTSDLDLLALAPPHIYRSDFFTSLIKLLQQDECCQDIHPIASAYTPVIKFVLECGECDEQKTLLQIDLVFARVSDATKLLEYQKQKYASTHPVDGIVQKAQRQVEYILDDSDLENLDAGGVRSLNGARVSQMLLQTVQHDVGKFQIVLCAVKQWAISRGIYSNVLGFLGGVNWAILVAWICKHYPNATASSSLLTFFEVFGRWHWGNPVLLTDKVADMPPITNAAKQTRAVQLPAWNPRTNLRDGLHVMPIITPAYPSMNSSYNVDYPQLRFMQHEMVRASKWLKQQQNMSTDNFYRSLFKPSDFFQRHKHFLQLNIRSSNQQDFVEWFRFVESKIRLLISNLETTELYVWPFARFFTKPKSHAPQNNSNESGEHEKYFYIALRFNRGIERIDIRHLTMDFLYKVNSWEGRKSSMDLSISHITDEDLPLFVWEAMKERRSHSDKDGGTERSVNSENTAPATDDEEDDASCPSVEGKSSPVEKTSPLKKYRVEMTSESK